MIRCRVCGRPLRTPTTAARGIGPRCARKTRQTTTTPRRDNPGHCPGQTTIPTEEHPMTTTPADRPDLPNQLRATLTERYTALGNPHSEMRRHEKGPDGWPASHPVSPHEVAEVLRELLADKEPPAPADRAATGDDVRARFEALAAEWEQRGKYGDASLLWGAQEIRATLAAEPQQPGTTDRAATLREAVRTALAASLKDTPES